MLEKKVAIITGSARGIGYEIGKAFAEEGATVVLSDINETAANESAQQLRESGLSVTALKTDVTKEEELKHLINKTNEKFGHVDIFVNNAGLQHVSPIEEFPTEKFKLMIQIMLVAPFIAIKNVLPLMKKQKYGRIINIASINGLIGFANKAAYNSAKHGVIGLTKVAALESAPYGVTVNALCPGYTETKLVRGQLEDLAKAKKVPFDKVLEKVIFPFVPQKRLLDVKEIANYATFLASEGARGVTGQAVVLDGGYTAQ